MSIRKLQPRNTPYLRREIGRSKSPHPNLSTLTWKLSIKKWHHSLIKMVWQVIRISTRWLPVIIRCNQSSNLIWHLRKLLAQTSSTNLMQNTSKCWQLYKLKTITCLCIHEDRRRSLKPHRFQLKKDSASAQPSKTTPLEWRILLKISLCSHRKLKLSSSIASVNWTKLLKTIGRRESGWLSGKKKNKEKKMR